jgi:hypothetical protein
MARPSVSRAAVLAAATAAAAAALILLAAKFDVLFAASRIPTKRAVLGVALKMLEPVE